MTADLTHLHSGALQPAAQGVDANAKVSGNLLGPPLLSNHPYRAGLEGLIIARRRRPFFLLLLFHMPAPFLTILFFTAAFSVRQFERGGTRFAAEQSAPKGRKFPKHNEKR